ncbi:MAG: 5'-methylthioadenosine nucleosidase [Bacteroidaceae bacterium]|nr:5'-methylthioadenosine nucleosidase [Bacteroidaceae bacterium]
MRAEARPFVEAYGLSKVDGFFVPLPCILYDGMAGDCRLSVVLNGEQHGTDLVGCEAASVATMAAIERLHPDMVVNSGTCGAFKAQGASIAEVFVGNGAMFHDRRVPGDDGFATQSLGNYAVWDGSRALAERLGLKMGKVTTGSSLDMQPCDLAVIQQHGGQLKDMEGAAVAFVCSLFHTPLLLVKSVTDLCDDGAATFEEFTKNLSAASQSLNEANQRIINRLSAL